MQSRLKGSVIAAALGIALVSGISAAHAQQIVGLSTTNAVFTTDVANVSNIALASYNGLVGFVNPSAATAVGIDLRPNGSGNYTLLSIEETSATNAALVGRLYDVNIGNGLLTNARTITGVNFLTPTGTTPTRYTVDFNPTGPVALRIVGSDGSNYRVGNLVGDGTATNNVTAVADSPLGQTGIVGVGYNNNVPFASSTQIFYTSASSSSLLTATTPNTPTLTTVGSLGIGLDSGGLQEIDIAASGVAYGSFQLATENFSRFYTVNTANGLATAVAGGNNAFRIAGTSANLSVRAFSVVATVVPEASTFALAIPALGLLGAVAVRRRKTA